jgi:hypothetical protein
MTTLRTFQNEMHEIHNREVSKQRAQLNLDKEKEKEIPNPRKHTNSKGKIKEELTASDVQAQAASGGESDHQGLQLQEIEEQIFVRRDNCLWPSLQLSSILDITVFQRSQFCA